MSRHFLIVTKDDRDDGYLIQVECTGPDDTCIPWLECPEDHSDIPDEVDDEGEGELHGVWHMRWYFGWATRATNCALFDAPDAWADGAYELARELGEGRHEVWFEWDDEYTIEMGAVK